MADYMVSSVQIANCREAGREGKREERREGRREGRWEGEREGGSGTGMHMLCSDVIINYFWS